VQVFAESKIDGAFTGWDGDNYYRLINGQVWRQAHYKYNYHYAYRPNARVLTDGSRYFLEVEGMNEIIEVRRASSTVFIYDSRGNAIGFWKGRYIYALNGNPIGQLNGTHVHKLSGGYVGELYKDMVVDKHIGSVGNIGHPGHPGNAGSPGNPGNRGSVSCAYPDVFHKLLE